MKLFKPKSVLTVIIYLTLLFVPSFFHTAAMGAVTVPGLADTQLKYAERWAAVSSVQQFAYKDMGIAYAYISGTDLIITTPEKSISVYAQYPLLGDVISDDDGNFYVVWGRQGSSSYQETMFISKYSPDGLHVGTTGFNVNTRIPFNGGSCDSAIGNGYLMVYYAREMYNGHQSSNVIGVKLSDMSPSGGNPFYVSHSFNQSVIWSEHVGDFIYADHGDGAPRGFAISSDLWRKRLFTFYLQPSTNYDMDIVNETFAQMGDLVETSAGVVLVGASARSIANAAKFERQDLFVQIFDPNASTVSESMFVGGEKRIGATSFDIYDNEYSPLTSVTDYGVHWLTDGTAVGIEVNAPQVVVAEDRIIILWSTFNNTYYMVLEANGDIFIPKSSLKNTPLNSYERPVYHDGNIYWVSAKDGEIEVQCIENIFEPQSVVMDFLDKNFENAVREIIKNPFDEILLPDVSRLESLDVSNKGIGDLTGIEYFTSLKSLDCGNNRLASLDVSKNTKLTSLGCYHNQLRTLDISKNTELTVVTLQLNKLTKLDVSKNKKLRTIICDYNYLESEEAITGLDKSITNGYYSFEPQYKVLSFPDPNFETAVRNAINKPSGEVLDCDVQYLYSLIMPYMKIRDITGIMDLPELEYVNCINNQITSIDVSGHERLRILDCTNNKLTSLITSGCTSLTTLECGHNALHSLNISGCTSLGYLFCNSNQLVSVDVSDNKALFWLDCENNLITELDVTKNAMLTRLYCEKNLLTELDVSKCTELSSFDCSENQITSLDISGCMQLIDLNCRDNRLTELDVSGRTLIWYLSCYNNQITELDVSASTKMQYLFCNNNELTELDVTNNPELIYFWCNDNRLTELDVSENEKLEILHCDINQLTTLDVSKNINLTTLTCTYNNMPSEDSIIGLNKAVTEKFIFAPQNKLFPISGSPTFHINQWILPRTTAAICRLSPTTIGSSARCLPTASRTFGQRAITI